MSADLRTALTRRLDQLDTPPGDLLRAVREGRARRRRRRIAGGTAGAAAVAVAASVAIGLVSDQDGHRRAIDTAQYASLGPLDLSEGARAFVDGREIQLGGRHFPAAKLDWLDTDTATTLDGLVFYDAGRPILLDDTGSFFELDPDAVAAPNDFHPTAKADADGQQVAWASWRDGVATVTVGDLSADEERSSTDLECGECGDLVIEGIDDGVVFVRDRDGTRTWDSATGEWSDFAGPRTRVADVRAGVVLYDGVAPAEPGPWRLVEGALDARLSFDGDHVLSWGSTLEPTTPGDPPVVLERGPADGGLGYWTFDSDGSVLVADLGPKEYPNFTIFDCDVPSGECTRIGTSGDAPFIGNDM